MAAALVAAAADTVPLTLRGCVVAGDAKDSYLLKDAEVEPAGAAPANAFYRFSSTNGLGSQVGYRVEIKGVADLTLKTSVDSEESMVMASEKNVWFGSAGATKLKANIITYKFDIQQVQRIPGGTCATTK